MKKPPDGFVFDQKNDEWLVFSLASRRGVIVNERGKTLVERLVSYVQAGHSTWDELAALVQEPEFHDPFLRGVLESGLGRTFDPNEPTTAAPVQAQPCFVYLHLTHDCNLACRYCFNAETRQAPHGVPPLTLSEYEHLFQELRQAQVGHIIFTGGEPLVHPDFFSLAEAAGRAGIGCSMITNATRITPEKARRLSELLTKISISVDCSRAEVHDFYRGTGSYQRALRGIEALAEVAPHKILLKAVITNRNTPYIEEYYHYFKSTLGITQFRFSPISPTCLEQCQDPDMSLSWENHLLMDRQIESFITADPDDLMDRCLWGELCGAASEIISLSPEGDLYPCQSFHFPELPTANVRHVPFLDAYQHSSIMCTLRELSVDDLPVCQDCDLRYVCCGGCRALAYKLYRDLKAYHEVFCRNYRREALNFMWVEARRQEFARAKAR